MYMYESQQDQMPWHPIFKNDIVAWKRLLSIWSLIVWPQSMQLFRCNEIFFYFFFFFSSFKNISINLKLKFHIFPAKWKQNACVQLSLSNMNEWQVLTILYILYYQSHLQECKDFHFSTWWKRCWLLQQHNSNLCSSALKAVSVMDNKTQLA